MTIGTVTLRDSAYVYVANGEPVVAGLSAAPVAPDTAKMAAARTKAVPGLLTGTDLAGMAVAFRVADTSIAAFGNGASFPSRTVVVAGADGRARPTLRGTSPGKTMVYVTATVRGVTWTDSVLFTVGERIQGTFAAYARHRLDGTAVYEFQPDTGYVMVGGTGSWSVLSGMPYSVIFEDSAKALGIPTSTNPRSRVSGNIPTWTYDNTDLRSLNVQRRFARPDTIRFHSPELNTGGVLIVVDERACLPNCPPLP